MARPVADSVETGAKPPPSEHRSPIFRSLTVVLSVVGGLFFGFLGLRIAEALADGDDGLIVVLYWTITPFGFTLFGALVAPFLLPPAITKVQEWGRSIRAAQLVLGSIGLIAGLLVGALLSPALFTLPGVGGSIAVFIVSCTMAALGIAVMASREEEFAGVLERYFPGTYIAGSPSHFVVVDTSAIIDGRIADIVATGFIQSKLIVPRFVLHELRHIADSSDSARRTRGRRGLEVLSRLQKEAPSSVIIYDEDFPDTNDVDAKLLLLCQKLTAPILTNDFNLNRVAEVEGVSVLNVNRLANAVKTVILPGEDMPIKVIQEGKEAGQGVGFLDDGTMVVVEDGKRHLNEELIVTVSRVIQTAAGRMIFAQSKTD
ncbi:MAG: PIN domain nuclease [Chloroflexi bacterium]|nr:PIN domain nuclease [Chloroflexota bacterium]